MNCSRLLKFRSTSEVENLSNYNWIIILFNYLYRDRSDKKRYELRFTNLIIQLLSWPQWIEAAKLRRLTCPTRVTRANLEVLSKRTEFLSIFFLNEDHFQRSLLKGTGLFHFLKSLLKGRCSFRISDSKAFYWWIFNESVKTRI